MVDGEGVRCWWGERQRQPNFGTCLSSPVPPANLELTRAVREVAESLQAPPQPQRGSPQLREELLLPLPPPPLLLLPPLLPLPPPPPLGLKAFTYCLRGLGHHPFWALVLRSAVLASWSQPGWQAHLALPDHLASMRRVRS